MSNNFTDKSPFGPKFSDNPLDEALAFVEHYSEEIGLTPEDRLYWFHRSQLALVNALVWSIKTIHADNERANEISHAKLEARTAAIEQSIRQIMAKLANGYAEQSRNVETLFAEISCQAKIILSQQSIESESRAFFAEFNGCLNRLNASVTEKSQAHVTEFRNITTGFKEEIKNSVDQLPKDLVADIKLKLRDTDSIVESVAEDLSEKTLQVVFQAVVNQSFIVTIGLVVVFGIGLFAGQISAFISSSATLSQSQPSYTGTSKPTGSRPSPW